MAALFWILLPCSCALLLSPLPLFEAYKGSPPCFRQPVLVSASPVLLAFAEGRLNSYCSGKDDGPAPRPIVLRRSLDSGVSWGPMEILYSGNVDFLTGVYDSVEKRVFLFIQVNGSVSVLLSSDDQGATWSQGKKVEIPLGKFKTVVPGVGVGIQLRGGLCVEPSCAGYVSRLLVPFICTTTANARVKGDIACPGCHSCLLVSDDHGVSWSLAASSSQDGSREASLVQLKSIQSKQGRGRKEEREGGARVYASERNMGNSTGHRWHAVSVDGGSSFSSFGADGTLPDGVTTNWTGVVSGLAGFDTDNVNQTVFIAPASLTSREDLTVYVSKDETQSWMSRVLLWKGPAAYSSAFQINSTHLGVLFENGEQEFAQRISFVALSSKDL